MLRKQSDSSSSQKEVEELRLQVQSLKNELANQKQAEKALLHEYSFRNAIIERTAEGVCVCHAISEFPYVKFTVWNARMTELTGYSLEEINRMGWYQTMYPDPDIQKKACERMEQMREGEDLHGERWEVLRHDGQQRTFSISTALLTTEDGLTHVLGLMQDVTNEEKYRIHLEAQVNELKNMLPICSSCKNIRDDKGYWHQVEKYIHDHFATELTHGICPDCVKKLYPEFYDSINSERKGIS